MPSHQYVNFQIAHKSEEGDTVKLKALYKKPGAETEMESMYMYFPHSHILVKVGKGGKKPRKGKRPSSRK